MNKLSKIFLVIIIILIIALAVMVFLYMNAVKHAKNNLDQVLKNAEEIFNLNIKISELEDEINESKSSISYVTNTTNAYTPEDTKIVDENGASKTDNVTERKKLNRDPEKVTIKIVEDTITPEGLTILITDKNENTYGYGEAYGIQVKKDNEWKDLESLPGTVWILLAYNPNEDGELSQKLDFTRIYGTLQKGTYRIVKTISDSDTGEVDVYSNEFEIK